MRGLKDKIVVVTGSSGGLGRAICARFVTEGCQVVGLDRQGVDAGLEDRHPHYPVDITDDRAVVEAVEAVWARFGSIDVVVNCAGWDQFGNFLDSNAETRANIVNINLHGVMNVLHAALKRIVAEGKPATVITIASDAGRVGSSGQSTYSACKGGVIALTKTLARELARKGVTLNVVCPGPMRTPMLDEIIKRGKGGDKIVDAMSSAIPLKRIAEPDDIVGMVAFLASDDAAYMTGQVVSVSGGLTMHG
jgi:2-hydroxycyclohexanecarboxyl-CoA dehydrogenase